MRLNDRLTYGAVAFVVATYIVSLLNLPFWRALLTANPLLTVYDFAFTGAVAAVAIAGYALVLLLPAPTILFKPITAIAIVLSAATSYFMNEYGVIIDVNMIRNALETNRGEAADLLTPGLAAYVTLLGVAPCIFLWRWPIAPQPLKSAILSNIKWGTSFVVAAVGIFAVFFMSFTSVFREHRTLLLSLNPFNVVSATTKIVQTSHPKNLKKPTVIGPDARKGLSWNDSKRRRALVLVIGETARADHFSLNAYHRPTTPLLEKNSDIVSLASATSCGTDTAVSLPCMFSGLGRENFSNARAEAQEGLLDVIQRAGVPVLWRENQSGCKGACDRVPTEILTQSSHTDFCKDGACHDEILLEGLTEKLDRLEAGGIIVLHMMGSHGPAYYKRYPAKFETFKPACKVSQFSHCSQEEIVNSYDNSILYTDHVLFRLTNLLEQQALKGQETAMLYVSDHGESLGEHNIYLHGMPYSLAPKAQTHVPMLLWTSLPYRDALGIDMSCLIQHATDKVTHDNLFHTVLGMLDIVSKVYRPELDIAAACRSGRRPERTP